MALLPAPVDAHAELISTEPAAGARLDAAPAQVVLRFTESVDVSDDAIELLSASGDPVDVGDPAHPNGERSSIAVGLPSLDDATYVVSWRVISSDSHPVSGVFTFGVGDAGAALSDADAQVLANEARAGAGSDRLVGVSYGLVRFAAFAGLVGLIGGAVFVAGWWPAGGGDRRARRILAGAWWVALGATVASIPLQAAYAAGGSLADAVDPSIIGDELGTRSGRAWLIRMALLAALAVIGPRLLRQGSERRTKVRLAAAVGAGVALLATITLTGHAVSGDYVGLAVVTDLVHLSAVSLWLGGLVLLLGAVLWPTAGVDDGRAEAIATRFSDVALGAVMVIVASGVVQARRQLRSWDALFDTSYGRLLLVKVGFVILMVAAAAATHSWVRQRARARMASLALSPDQARWRPPDAAPCRCSGGRWRPRSGSPSPCWRSPQRWSTPCRAHPRRPATTPRPGAGCSTPPSTAASRRSR